MRNKILKHRITNLIIIVLFFLIVAGCAGHIYLVRGEEKKLFTITGSDYDEAFSKAVRTANEIDMSIYTSDKNSGTFSASRGSGLGEMTAMDFFLGKESQDKLTCIIKVKSSKGSENVINEFVIAYGKYVKISSMEKME